MQIRHLIVIAILATACGKAPQVNEGPQGFAELKFIEVQEGITGLVAQVKKPTMSACITGIPSADKKVWEDKIKSVVIKWVDTMRPLTSDALATGVDLNLDGRGCDVDMTVRDGVWANTEVGQHPTVNMGASGYMAGYNTMLHEFGHAFALGDTYQNGQSGNCQPGQPQAVMCNTSFDTPQADDIKGITALFKEEFPNDKPGDPTAPISKYKLFAALGQENAGDFDLKFALTGDAEKTGGKLEICKGTLAACKGAAATWTEAKREGAKGDAVIFGLAAQQIAAGQVTIRYAFDKGAAYQAVELKPAT